MKIKSGNVFLGNYEGTHAYKLRSLIILYLAGDDINFLYR